MPKNALTQINLPPKAAETVLKVGQEIPEAELAGDGRETEPHITLKYGVEEDVIALTQALRDIEPFEVTLGKLHGFEGHSTTPIVALVEKTPEIENLKNAIDKAIGVRPDDFEYTPHVTVAYVTTEAAAKYEGSDALAGLAFTVYAVTLSRKDKSQVQVPLGEFHPVEVKKTSAGLERIRAYHGTDSDTPPSHNEIYFAEDPGDARDYGPNVFTATLTPKKMLSPKDRNALWDVLKVVLLDQKGLTVDDLVSKKGIHYSYLWNYPEIAKRMRELGYDGAFIDEPMSANGQSILILNPAVIQWKTPKTGAYDRRGIEMTEHDYQRDAAFEQLASAQRGAPEEAMLKIQHDQLASGVLSFVVEHTGDLTHRMSENFSGFRGQWGNVKDKVEKVLRVLQNPYGFVREMEGNQRNNYNVHKEEGTISLSFEDAVARLKVKCQAYADAHAQLTVYNNAQRIARDAAVALGQWKFSKCENLLEDLKKLLAEGHDKWQEIAGEFTPGKTASHKTPPLSDTQYQDPAQGEETNAYSVVNERVKGVEGMPALETLAPGLFEKEADVYSHIEGQDAAAQQIIEEYTAHLKQKNYRQKWTLVPAARLKKIWNDYAKTGFVRDEKGIDDIAWIIANNINKLEVNTILCGHEQQDPIQYAEGITGDQYPDGYFEKLEHFFDDEKGNWRISDFAMNKLTNLAIQLSEAPTAEQKLQLIDRVLNIVHQRSDLASWFIEGGSNTLSQLSGTGKSGSTKTAGPDQSYMIPQHSDSAQPEFDKPLPSNPFDQEMAQMALDRLEDIAGKEEPTPSQALQWLDKTGAKDKPSIETHGDGSTIWIDMFVIPAKDRGKGLGRKFYMQWEAGLPKNIKLVRLYAGDTGAGSSRGFWDSMGFSYVYDTEQGDETDNYMWKGVNGGKTPPSITSDRDPSGYDVEDEPEKLSSKTGGYKELKKIPPSLSGLAAEARKAGSFEQFYQDFFHEIKHGTYWHVTTDPNFTIDPKKGPRDMSSMGDATADAGKLMITSHLDNWADYYGKSRAYAAQIDMSDVPRDKYWQVKRGFGNEFWVEDPKKAKVLRVMPIGQAKALDHRIHNTLSQYITSDEDLIKFYELATGDKAKQPGDFRMASVTAGQAVSGEVVAQHILDNSTRYGDSRPFMTDLREAYQLMGVDPKTGASTRWELKDVPVDLLTPGDDYSPAVAQQYADMDTPFPAIVMNSYPNGSIFSGTVLDGNHRAAAAKLRGDETIQAYVPVKRPNKQVVDDTNTDELYEELKTSKSASGMPDLEDALAWANVGLEEAQGDWDKIEAEARQRVKAEGNDWNTLSEAQREAWLDKVGWEWLRASWEITENRLHSLQFPLTIYRGLGTVSLNEINKGRYKEKGTGIFWSDDENNAYVHEELAAGHPHIIMLRGILDSPNKVDWNRTAYVNLVAADEKEINVVPGAEIQITGYKYKGEKEWKKPPKNLRTVTAGDTIDMPWFSEGASKTAAELAPPLYHGTCPENAKELIEHGWQPNKAGMGGNAGQTKYLYLTNEIQNALWYAGEKGCETVVEVRDVPLDNLIVDPEDGVADDVLTELAHINDLPGNVCLTRPLPPTYFRVVSGKAAAAKVAQQYGPVYRGIPVGQKLNRKIKNDQYTVGEFFTSSPEVARAYGPQVHQAYLTINKPYIVDAEGNFYDNIPAPPEMQQGFLGGDWWKKRGVSSDLIAEFAHKNGYDGVIIKNVIEPHALKAGDDYIVFKSSQIKQVGEPIVAPKLRYNGHDVPLKFSAEEDDLVAGRWRPWIGVDLDGTLAEDVVPFTPLVIGKPIPAMVEKVKQALKEGKLVKVFTARLADLENKQALHKLLREWTEKHIGTPLEATNIKDPGLIEMWDDKARQVKKDTGEFVAGKKAFTIEVPSFARDHFFEDSGGKEEFWAFKDRPLCLHGEQVVFTFDRYPVAEAVALRVEEPGKTKCDATGLYGDHYKVFWTPASFKEYGVKTALHGRQTFDLWAIVNGQVEVLRGVPSEKGHLEWFKAMGLPTSGHSFDRIPRGDARKASTQIFLRESSDYGGVPYEVIDEFQQLYPEKEVVAQRPLESRSWKTSAEISLKSKNPALEEFMNDFRSGTGPNPLGHRDRVWNEQVVIEVRPFDGKIHISDITSLFRGKGNASRALDWLCSLADKHGVKMSLTPDAFGDGQGLDDEQLTSWYSRRGFKTVRGTLMVRDPQGSKVAAIALNCGKPGVRLARPKMRGVPMPMEIRDDGWVTPTGNWVDCSDTDHETMAMQFGFRGHDLTKQAIDKGYVRVVIDPNKSIGFMQFADKADAYRRAGEILRRFPVDIARVGVEEGRGNFIEYSLADAEERFPAGRLAKQGFWGGKSGQASGILPVCPAKGTICLAMRSNYVDHPNVYSTIGGALQEGLGPAESAKKELAEETGYTGGINLIPAFTYSGFGGFNYHNFIGVVSQEFGLNPQPGGTHDLEHKDETASLNWVPYETVMEDIGTNSSKYHPGLLKLFQNSGNIIRKALGKDQEKTAARVPASNYLIWMSRGGKDYIEDQEIAWSHDSWAEELGIPNDSKLLRGYAVIDPDENTVEMQSYGVHAPNSIVTSIKAKYPKLKSYQFTDKIFNVNSKYASVDPNPKSAADLAVDKEWQQRLEEMNEPELRTRPDLVKLRDKILGYGGFEVLIGGQINPPDEVQRLLTRGRYWKGRSKLQKMRNNQCHGNSRCLMEKGIGEVANGFALSPDGLWRPHSWLVTPKGTLIETTVKRDAYFGAVLTRDEVDKEYDPHYGSVKTAKTVLYHGSRKKFQPGDTLTPQPGGYVTAPEPDVELTEDIVELHRPKGALPRKDSVYMVDDPALIDYAGGYEDYVYAVEPIGKVEKNDMDWYSELSTYIWDSIDDPEAARLAQGYWSGKAKGGEHTLFEYRARKAKVVKLISSTEEDVHTAASPARAPQRVTDTPQFKAWFGNSKVVDANGNPQVVYHGSPRDFDAFSLERPLYWKWSDFDGGKGAVGQGEGRTQAVIVEQEGKFKLFPDGGEFGTLQQAKDKVEADRPKTTELTLRPGFFFASNPMYTEQFTYSYDPGGKDREGGNVKAVYLKMENPLDFRDPASRRWVREWLRKHTAKLQGYDPKHIYKLFREGKWAFVEGMESVSTDEQLGINLVNDIKSAGYDGYITVEGGELQFVGQSDEDYAARAEKMYGRGGLDASLNYVVFEPTQIKSATGNTGAFDPKNPGITAAAAGTATQPITPTALSYPLHGRGWITPDGKNIPVNGTHAEIARALGFKSKGKFRGGGQSKGLGGYEGAELFAMRAGYVRYNAESAGLKVTTGGKVAIFEFFSQADAQRRLGAFVRLLAVDTARVDVEWHSPAHGYETYSLVEAEERYQ
jgi:2'-5' RNA ligase/8-oxo-dGTP pyrophosphatase MutT (NUDIX family)